MFKKFFQLDELKTTVKTEIVAGSTTFMTMSYIIFVQPAVLSTCGMDFGAVIVATCISSALATILLGILTNYPIAQAPAMGHNFFFAFTVCAAMKIPWQTALGAIFVSGSIFIILSFMGFTETIVNAVPESLKNSIAVGIGLLIAFVGFEWAGIVVDTPGTLVGLGDLTSAPVLLSLFGLFVIAILLTLKVKGAILWGIIIATVAGIPFHIVQYHGIFSLPPSLSPTLFKLDILGAFNLGLFTVIFVFFFLDLFDTVGTLIGVGQQAGFIREGKLPKAGKALFSDAFGTLCGALLGTSTVTSYIESITGVSEGGRSGLSNIVTGILFLGALFFYPLIKMVGGGYETTDHTYLYPTIAPALIIVGSIMLRGITKISWDDYTESIPAFLTLMIMPVTFSITEGIAFGFISYALLKLVSKRGKEVHWLVYLFSFLFLIRYTFLI